MYIIGFLLLFFCLLIYLLVFVFYCCFLFYCFCSILFFLFCYWFCVLFFSCFVYLLLLFFYLFLFHLEQLTFSSQTQSLNWSEGCSERLISRLMSFNIKIDMHYMKCIEVHNISVLRSSKLVIIERLLLLAERYVITIEVRANIHTHTHTHTHTCWFVWFTGTLHRRNCFYAVQTVFAIAVHHPYT